MRNVRSAISSHRDGIIVDVGPPEGPVLVISTSTLDMIANNIGELKLPSTHLGLIFLAGERSYTC